MYFLPTEIKAYQGRGVEQKGKKVSPNLAEIFVQIKKMGNIPETSLFHSLDLASFDLRREITRTHRIKMTSL